MKNFKQVLGALSRDMLFLHGHVVSIRGLDGAAQRSTYPVVESKPHKLHDTAIGTTDADHADGCGALRKCA